MKEKINSESLRSEIDGICSNEINELKIGAIGVNAYDRYGLSEYFGRYDILCLKDSSLIDIPANKRNKIFSLMRMNSEIKLVEYDTEHMLSTPDLRNLLDIRKYNYLLIYRPNKEIENQLENLDIKLLANNSHLVEKLENKEWFRLNFSDVVRFPPYKAFRKIETNEIESYAIKELNKYGEIVIQDVLLSGGRGTFFCKDQCAVKSAVEFLTKKDGETLLISRFVEGSIVSVQGCVTKYGVISTGMQQQLIDEPCLGGNMRGGWKFCGGQSGMMKFPKGIVRSLYEAIDTIGQRLFTLGYRGIFGLDVIISEDKKVYFLEINPRFTGMTPFLLHLQKSYQEVPLSVLHVLELSGIQYSLSDVKKFRNYCWKERRGGYFIIHNQAKESVRIKVALYPGIYKFKRGRLEFSRYSDKLCHVIAGKEVLIIDAPVRGSVFKRGSRVLRILAPEPVASKKGILTKRYHSIVNYVRSEFLEAVTI